MASMNSSVRSSCPLAQAAEGNSAATAGPARMEKGQPPARALRTSSRGEAERRSLPMDERQLLAALSGSNREVALGESIRRFGPMVKRTAWRITGDEHRADDVCQAVFLVLL